MQLRYGSYTWAASAVALSQEQVTLWNAGGQPYAVRKTFRLDGYITGNTQAEISAAMTALEAALAIPYRDLTLLHDDGSESAAILRNRGSITGVMPMMGPGYPDSLGFEFAPGGGRHFTASFEAEYPVAGARAMLLDWVEEVEFWGGGPLRGVTPNVNTIPQEQIIWGATPFEAVQTGTITGYLSYPPIPPAKFPAALVRPFPRRRKRSPTRRGNGWQGFPITYTWEFISAAPLDGVPSLWR